MGIPLHRKRHWTQMEIELGESALYLEIGGESN
jgi:hypothetical protein